MTTNPRLVARLRDVLAQGPALRLAMLFGSAAVGLEHAASDVDVAIVPRDPDLSLRDELELQARLEQVCGCQVDLVRLDCASTVLRWQVASKGVVLLADPPHEAARFVARAASEYGDFAPALEHASRTFARRLAGRAAAGLTKHGGAA